MGYNPDQPGSPQPPLSVKLFLPEQSNEGTPEQANDLPTQLHAAHQQDTLSTLPAQDVFDAPEDQLLFPPKYTPDHDELLANNRFINQRAFQPAPAGAMNKLRALWNKDPAYKVLLASIAAVILVTVIFVTIVAAMVMSHISTQGRMPQSVPNGVGGLSGGTPTANHTPVAHKSTPTSLVTPTSTPLATPTPTPAATATASAPTPVPPVPTAVPPTSTSVQITNIPQEVSNGQYVNVTVNAPPGSSVSLSISYNMPPFQGSAGPKSVKGNGNATLSWHVQVVNLLGGSATATVTAIATDQNGNQTSSAPVQVTIH